MRPVPLSVAAFMVAGSTCCWGAPATAEPAAAPAEPSCTESPEECGRQAFDQGVSAYKARDFQTAQTHFREALAFRWHPAIAMNLALSLKEDGRMLAAIQVLEQILDHEETKESLAKAAETQRRLAEEQLAEIEIVNSGTDTLSMTVDGDPVTPNDAGLTKLDPGTHQVEVRVGDQPSTRRQITLAAAERVRLNVSPTREIVLSVPTPSAVNTEDPIPPPDQPAVAPERGLSPIVFYVGAGVTAVLGGVTLWSAIDTRRAFDDYERDLPSLSQPEVDARVDAGHSKEKRTNVLLGVTAGAAATSAVLGVFLTNWNSGRTTAAIRADPEGAAVRMSGTF